MLQREVAFEILHCCSNLLPGGGAEVQRAASGARGPSGGGSGRERQQQFIQRLRANSRLRVFRLGDASAFRIEWWRTCCLVMAQRKRIVSDPEQMLVTVWAFGKLFFFFFRKKTFKNQWEDAAESQRARTQARELILTLEIWNARTTTYINETWRLTSWMVLLDVRKPPKSLVKGPAAAF